MKEPNMILYFIFFRFFRALLWVLFKVFFGLKFIGKENIPKTGGIIVMPNHSSYFDPPTAGQLAFVRDCRFMARDTLFRNPVFGWIIRHTGAFPVKRGKVDRESWSTFIELVKKGWAVMFFPEGTRTETGEIQEGKPGTGMLVYQSKAPVLPVYIHGAYTAWKKGGKIKFFTPITVVYGKPIMFDDLFLKEEGREVYEEITKRVIEELRRMKKEFYEGRYK